MDISITGLENIILQAAAAATTAALGFAFNAARVWLKGKISDQQIAQLDSAATKALIYGFQQVPDLIKEHGWDHIEVKNETIAHAVSYLLARFPDALKNAGFPVNDPAQLQIMAKSLLERALPQAATLAASSPATPPATVQSPGTMVIPASV